MSLRTLMGAAALILAPLSALHSQQDSAANRTWGVNPGGTGGKVPTTATPAPAPSTPTPAPQQSVADIRADTAVVRQALAVNALEIRGGQLGQRRASNAAVKQFAQRLVTEHTQAQRQWAALASRNGQATAGVVDPTRTTDEARLNALSGPAFDQAFMDMVVTHHQQDANIYQRLVQNSTSGEVRQLASTALAATQQHLSAAQQIQNQIRGTAVATATSGATTGNKAAAAAGTRSDEDVAGADRAFVREVATDHQMEVRLAQLAQRKAKNADVRRFAGQMADDFGKWQDRWNETAGRGNNNAGGLGKLHQQKVDRVNSASGKNADRTYLSTVIEHLESMVPYYEKEGRDVRSSKVKNMVNDELPLIRDRLATARRLQKQA